jgi:hypothetical protein
MADSCSLIYKPAALRAVTALRSTLSRVFFLSSLSTDRVVCGSNRSNRGNQSRPQRREPHAPPLRMGLRVSGSSCLFLRCHPDRSGRLLPATQRRDRGNHSNSLHNVGCPMSRRCAWVLGSSCLFLRRLLRFSCLFLRRHPDRSSGPLRSAVFASRVPHRDGRIVATNRPQRRVPHEPPLRVGLGFSCLFLGLLGSPFLTLSSRPKWPASAGPAAEGSRQPFSLSTAIPTTTSPKNKKGARDSRCASFLT